MGETICRSCRGRAGYMVLDLGEQPACDYFPRPDDPGPDPLHPLQMWLCSSCGLAQLVSDPGGQEEPLGQEPAALVAQAVEAVERVSEAGWLREGSTVAECGSPHGGSWLGLLKERGLVPVGDGEAADVVVDCFGMMHAPDQASALAARAELVAPGGTLLLQYHSLETIIRHGQWNSLRHGHFAYYSTTALTRMLAAHGFGPRTAWKFDLYGGTVLLAATRHTHLLGGPDDSVQALLAEEARTGVEDPAVLGGLQQDAHDRAKRLHDWLVEEHAAGANVVGYGAASRAVALLLRAGVDRELLPGVVDASPAKHGLRMPGTDIPVLDPGQLVARRPDAVLLFVPDLMREVRAAYPEVEASGAMWVDVDALGF